MYAILSTVYFSYDAYHRNENMTIINKNNCESIYFISFLSLINGFINISTMKEITELIIFSMITTLSLFSFSIYRLISEDYQCIDFKNILFIVYICSLLNQAFTLLLYLFQCCINCRTLVNSHKTNLSQSSYSQINLVDTRNQNNIQSTIETENNNTNESLYDNIYDDS